MAHDIFSGQDVAVKLKPTRGAHCTLEHKFHVYKKLAEGPGISIVHLFGIKCGYNALVMDCLGPSLEQLFGHCHFQFSVKTVFLLASQLVIVFWRLPKPEPARAGISRLYKRAEPSQAKLLSEPSWMSQAGQNAGYGKAPALALAQAEFESGALSHQCRPCRGMPAEVQNAGP